MERGRLQMHVSANGCLPSDGVCNAIVSM
jgi:hypothetical protein